MTRKEFTDQVLLSLGRLTADEREDVRRELEEHVEDRMEALLDMGWDEGLAEERCLEAMGDPGEIGRELAKQYQGRGWLWLGRAALLLTVVLCAQALLSLGALFHARDSLEARIYPRMDTQLDQAECSERVNLKIPMGNDVLRVFRVTLGRHEGQRVAEIAMCAYDRWPFGIVVNGWQRWVTLGGDELTRSDGGTFGADVDIDRKIYFHGGRSGYGSYGASYWQTYLALRPEDRSLFLTYERFGERQVLEIPLPEEEETP